MESIDILIVCALRPEASAISSRMVDARRVDVGDCAGHLGEFLKRNALLVRTGPGSQNSAEGLRAALKQFAPKLVVNFGTAGAIADDLEPGDFVVSRRSLAYDPAIFGAPVGDDESAPIDLDEELAAKMSEYRLATFGSADFSVADDEARSTLRALFDFDVVDWETHSVLCVAREAKIPAFSFRAITDLAGTDAEKEFRDNHRRIVEDAAMQLGELLSKLDFEWLDGMP